MFCIVCLKFDYNVSSQKSNAYTALILAQKLFCCVLMHGNRRDLVGANGLNVFLQSKQLPTRGSLILSVVQSVTVKTHL